ncbi:MAG: MarR family transcriptional regulator [Alphaproteobacteria bacterium]|jgi:DNA-binding MarR family transcriptional regulator|nr:MarR family transcriptional regulator [Alphaproteobacteria bacterium]MDP6518055.1 MarR family transcriptional regulator [Alphaproteobacteria bacterium]
MERPGAPVDTVGDHESAMTRADAFDIRLWLRLLTCSTLIEHDLRGLLNREFGTTLPRFDALAQLERAPSGLTMGALSRQMMVTNGNVTGVVDRLVRDGLATREPSKDDRRACIVTLTEAGRRLFATMTPVHHARVQALLAGLDQSDAKRLYALLALLKVSVGDVAAYPGGARDRELGSQDG